MSRSSSDNGSRRKNGRNAQSNGNVPQEPLLQELTAAGYSVKSVWDLVNTTAPYPQALPILLRHLSRPYPGRVREGIARALAVPQAKSGWDVLVKLYLAEEDKGAKDGLAVAIAAACDDDVSVGKIRRSSPLRQRHSVGIM